MDETFQNEKGWPVCARSLANAGLLTKFELHFAPAEEQAANGGCCAKCAEEIRKQQQPWIEGRTNEEPGSFSPDPTREFQEHEHVAYEARDGMYEGLREIKVVPTVDFDFAAVDGELDNVPADARAQAAEVLRKVFHWCYPAGGATSLTLAAGRLAVLVSGMNPMALDGKTLEEIGCELKKTKAAMSKASLVAQAKFGIKFKRSRSEESRANMSKAQIGKRHRRSAQSQTAE